MVGTDRRLTFVLDGKRAQELHLGLVEFEVASLLLSQVGQVEGDAHEVALCRIITLVGVIVDDHVVAIVLGRRHILEVVQVERVGENIVRVGALEGLARGLGSVMQRTVLSVGEHG